MSRVLLASGSEKAGEVISALLKQMGIDTVVRTNNCEDIRKLIKNFDFELIILNAPLKDDFGKDLAIFLSEEINAVVFICKAQLYDEVSADLLPYGICTVANPLNKTVFEQSVKLILATQRNVINLRRENIDLKNKLEEVKIINRAKIVLVQSLKFTENQAHKHIEKTAMDRRQTKVQVARDILKTYEM
ncbi:MAG: ANTAR domain-containing protein [Oscillospiraceae bacterium]|jgi:response regulator NasT|nr:ANTAR domain-containing protein [Oscillospiraceae bacterium]